MRRQKFDRETNKIMQIVSSNIPSISLLMGDIHQLVNPLAKESLWGNSDLTVAIGEVDPEIFQISLVAGQLQDGLMHPNITLKSDAKHHMSLVASYGTSSDIEALLNAVVTAWPTLEKLM